MIPVQWLGRVPYAWAWRLQRLRRDAILRGTAPEVVWTLEHDPVVTTGRRPVALDEAALAARGVPVFRTERGGLATWHGPGQLTGYLLLDLGPRRWRVRDVVHGMEDGLIHWLAEQGIQAGRRQGLPGVWVGQDKVAAIGLRVSAGVTMHGFALNLSPSLEAFGWFTPCGVTDGGVTSVERLVGEAPTPFEASEAVGRAVLAGIARAHA